MKRRQSNPSNTGGKGAKRMRQFGYKQVALWLDATEFAAVRAAANKDGKPVASYVRQLVCDAVGVHYAYR